MKKYTSHDMREATSALSSSGVSLKFDKRDISELNDVCIFNSLNNSK